MQGENNNKQRVVPWCLISDFVWSGCFIVLGRWCHTQPWLNVIWTLIEADKLRVQGPSSHYLHDSAWGMRSRPVLLCCLLPVMTIWQKSKNSHEMLFFSSFTVEMKEISAWGRNAVRLSSSSTAAWSSLFVHEKWSNKLNYSEGSSELFLSKKIFPFFCRNSGFSESRDALLILNILNS